MSAEQNPEIVHEPTMIEVFAGELEDELGIRLEEKDEQSLTRRTAGVLLRVSAINDAHIQLMEMLETLEDSLEISKYKGVRDIADTDGAELSLEARIKIVQEQMQLDVEKKEKAEEKVELMEATLTDVIEEFLGPLVLIDGTQRSRLKYVLPPKIADDLMI